MKKSTRKPGLDEIGTKRRLPYVLMDVFTRKPLEGNQLAVFTDGGRLSDQEMQALARETNLAETTFIIPRDAATEENAGIEVRIFTIQEELGFAGHPTLGTAMVLRRMRGDSPGRIDLKLRVGKIPVTFSGEADDLPFGEMRQPDPVAGAAHSREDVARVIGISIEELDPKLPIQTFSTGLTFAIVPLRSLAAIRKLNFAWRSAAEYLARSDAKFFYLVTRETVNPRARLNARMIFYNGEDPATGSAAGCAAAWMVANGVAQSDEQVMIEQGLEIRRPSEIFVRASRNRDRIDAVRVGGYAVEIARGEVLL